MKLIVGLGNPGKEYENTRHNMGFIFIDAYAKKYNERIDKTKFNGKYKDIIINGEKAILLKPESFINLSGEVIRKYIDFFKIESDDILIINDDLDLSFGTYKLRPTGGSAGHNGLKNIELHLNTKDYKRLKIGISNNKCIDTKDYVLGKFNKEEKDTLETMSETISNLIDDFMKLTFDELMAKYNHK